MAAFLAQFQQLLTRNQRGATAIEYALLAGMIALVLISGIQTIGNKTGNSFNKVANKLV